MSLVVNTNVGSLFAQRALAVSSAETKTVMERLSTGSKINSASDDAAGFAISERMTAQINSLNMAVKNANDGLAMFAAGESAAQGALSLLQRVRELAVQASNDTNSQRDRGYLNAEAVSLLKEVDRIASSTQFNNQSLLNGSMEGVLQIGGDTNQTIDFQFGSIKTEDLGLNYQIKENIAHVSSAVSSSNAQGEISTRAYFDQDWDAQRAAYYASHSRELQVDDWNHKVLGQGLDGGQFYIDFEGLIDVGSQIRIDYRPQLEMSTHHESITTANHTVDSQGNITTKIFFDSNSTGGQGRVAYEVAQSGRVDVAHLNYAVLNQGIEGGNYFIEIDGYVTTDHSVQLVNNKEKWGNTWISSIQSIEINEVSEGNFESKLIFGPDDYSVSHQRADYFARKVGSVLVGGREYEINDFGQEAGGYFLTVGGLVFDQNSSIHGDFRSDLTRNLNIETVIASDVEQFDDGNGGITSRLLFDARPERAQLYSSPGDTIFLGNLDFNVVGSGTNGSGQFYLDVEGLVTNGYVSGFITSQMRKDNDMASYEFSPKGIVQFVDVDGSTMSQVSFNSWDASLASSVYLTGKDIMLGGINQTAVSDGINDQGDYFLNIQGALAADAQMAVSSLHNPYFWWGDYPSNVSHVVEADGRIVTELSFSDGFQSNMVSQRANSTGSLEVNGNTFDVVAEGYRGDGTYYVSVSGFVGNFSWIEYSSPTNMDNLVSGNSLRVAAIEQVPQLTSEMAVTRVYFEEGWASTQASSAVRGNDQFVYEGHSLTLRGEGVNATNEYFIEIQGSLQKQDGEDFWLNLINRPGENFGWNGSNIQSVSYSANPQSGSVISTVTLDSSGNTTSLSHSITQTGSIITENREFSVVGQTVDGSGDLVLEIDGYIHASAHLHPEVALSQTVPSANGLNNPLNVSYSVLNDGRITSRLEVGSTWEAQRADYVGDKYGTILIDNLPLEIIEEGLEANGNFFITVDGYVQANRHLGYAHDDHQSTNSWLGHVTASHQVDERGEVVSRIKTDGGDLYHERGFAQAVLADTLASNGHKLNVISQGLDEHGQFYADIDGFVEDGSGIESTVANPNWKQRNHLANVNHVQHAQVSNSVHSTMTFDDAHEVQRVLYFAEMDGALYLDNRRYEVVAFNLENDGSLELTLDGFVTGDFSVSSNSYLDNSQKVHLDTGSITHSTATSGSFVSTIILNNTSVEDLNQYVERDGKIISEGLAYQVTDHGVDAAGSTYLTVSGYVSPSSSIGTLSDINAVDERYNRANLHLGHIDTVEASAPGVPETSKLFFGSEHDAQLASQFAKKGAELFVDQQQFEVIGSGLQAGSFYIEVSGAATTGSLWVDSDTPNDQDNWLGHPQSVSNELNADGEVSATITFNEHDEQRASLSISVGDVVYNDPRGMGYRVLETGVSSGDFFIKVEGYISQDNGLFMSSDLQERAKSHVSNIQEGNSEVLVPQGGIVRSKLLVTENVQDVANLVSSGESLYLDGHELNIESMALENDDLYLIVEGVITSGGIQKRSEFVDPTFVDLQNNAKGSIEGIDFAMEKIREDVAGYGASQNRLSFSVSNLMTVASQTEGARSQIQDADFASEGARLAKAQVLKQSGAAMLAQANASSQLVLSLIR